MSVLPMRAETLKGDMYHFTVLDIPVVVGSNEFVLLGRKFSPILKYDTLVIGSDVRVYVGDVLHSCGKEWYVVCDSGIVAKSFKGNKRKRLCDFDNLEVVRQVTKEEWSKYRVGEFPVRFKAKGKTFIVPSIIGKYQQDMILCCVPWYVGLHEIQQDVGMSYRRRRLYLGDMYNDSPIVMCYGRLCSQDMFGVYDILEHAYIM